MRHADVRHNHSFVSAEFSLGNQAVHVFEPKFVAPDVEMFESKFVSLDIERLKTQSFRRPSRPAFSGSVLPQDRCASLGNSYASARVGPPARRVCLVDDVIFIARQRGSVRTPHSLMHQPQMRAYKCESKHECIAMLPLMHASEGKSDRCAGSSPL